MDNLNRRLMGFIKREDIPSSAVEVTAAMSGKITANTFYVPVEMRSDSSGTSPYLAITLDNVTVKIVYISILGDMNYSCNKSQTGSYVSFLQTTCGGSTLRCTAIYPSEYSSGQSRSDAFYMYPIARVKSSGTYYYYPFQNTGSTYLTSNFLGYVKVKTNRQLTVTKGDCFNNPFLIDNE